MCFFLLFFLQLKIRRKMMRNNNNSDNLDIVFFFVCLLNDIYRKAKGLKAARTTGIHCQLKKCSVFFSSSPAF